MSLLLRHSRVVDPSQGLDRVTNVLLVDGKVAALDAPDSAAARVIDCTGKIVTPGLIDLHVHLREPGFEEDETIVTGTAAALAGGFTAVACVGDTDPPLDTQGAVEFVRHQADEAKNCRVHVIACVSQGRKGEQLAEIGQLVRAGAVAFSDDDGPIHNPELLRRAFEYCRMFDKPVFNHAEVRELTHGGVMHEGRTSLVLGLPGMPPEAEDVMTSRDLALAEVTGGRLHLMHVSSAGSIELIRQAKRRGVRVTAEVCPHQLLLTDETLRSFDSAYKTNPPLRSPRHVEACLAGLADGTIDVICSDHMPLAREKKMREVDQAPFGIAGIETVLGLVITKLILPGTLDWLAAIARLSTNPAKILGLPHGTLAVGAPADVTIIDPLAKWRVEPAKFRSKSGNTPFAGWELQGRAETVIVGGEIKFTLDSRAEALR